MEELEIPDQPLTPEEKRRMKGLINQYYTAARTIHQLLGLTEDAQVIIDSAEERAHDIVIFSRQNPDFKKFLDSANTRSALTAIVMGHAGMLAAIMSNHGITVYSMARAAQSGISKWAQNFWKKPMPSQAPQSSPKMVQSPVQQGTPPINPDAQPTAPDLLIPPQRVPFGFPQ